jgi:hypothetical protein
MKNLPSREWRIFLLSVALVVCVGVYVNVEFGAMLTRQAKAVASADRLVASRAKLQADVDERRAALAPEGQNGNDGSCGQRAAVARAAEMAVIKRHLGAEPTADNVFGFCMKGYYGAEKECISWLNEQMRDTLARYDSARALCARF